VSVQHYINLAQNYADTLYYTAPFMSPLAIHLFIGSCLC